MKLSIEPIWIFLKNLESASVFLLFILIFISCAYGQSPLEKKYAIVFLHHLSESAGGLQNELLTSAEYFNAHGHKVLIIAGKKSPTAEKLKTMSLAFEESNYIGNDELVRISSIIHQFKERTNEPLVVIGFNSNHIKLYEIFKKNKIDCLCLMKLHIPDISIIETIKENHAYVDGVLCLNKKLASSIDIPMPKIVCPPFFDITRFENYVASQESLDHFKSTINTRFQSDLFDKTVITMIANFYVGPFEHKSHTLLLDALEKLAQTYNDSFTCLLAGSGKGFHSIRSEIRKRNLEPLIKQLGFVTTIPELLSCTDIHVLSSANEPFGIVHAEAGLLGVPSVGAKETGAEDIIIDGKTGFLFENKDADSLAQILHNLIINKSLRQEMGKESKKHIAAKFTNDKKYAIHLQFFDEAMSFHRALQSAEGDQIVIETSA